MAVTVGRPPRAPKLNGDYKSDYDTMYGYCREMSRWADQAWQRMGATTDIIAETVDTAETANATAAASQAGATIPISGGAVTLTPTNPLSYTLIDNETADINVAQHTRTGAASTLTAGTVSSVLRGTTFYVYYADAGDLGGTQTFLASASLSTVTGTPDYRIIGTIKAPAASYGDRSLD